MPRYLAVLLSAALALPAFAQDKPFHRFDEPIPVGSFSLRERSGQDVRDRDLLGKVWVAQFFYPGCNLCSRNTPTMQKLHEHYRGKADVRLVSIDLLNVPLPTLRDYADTYGANADGWLFLTGPEGKVHDIVRLGFFNMTFRNKNPEPGDQISHSTYLVLIDHAGHMIGYAEGTDKNAVETLQVEIERLRVRRRLEQPIPIPGAMLPHVNAILNSACAVLLILGWIAIKQRYETLHKISMLLALAVSMTFLASYLFYHFVVLEMEPMRFQGTGAARYVYFTILLSHTSLAILVAPLALFLAVQGLRDQRVSHVKLARWTLPMWLYVSVTGVCVYWMLYRSDW